MDIVFTVMRELSIIKCSMIIVELGVDMKILLIALYSLFALVDLYAESTVECDNVAMMRCMCDAPMIINCSGLEGNVKADAPLKYVRITVKSKNGQTKEVTLQNPPGGIRNYYAAQTNEWVISQLKNLKFGDDVTVSTNGYGLGAETPLYSDTSAKNVIGTVSSKALVNEEQCKYVDEVPLVASYGSCSGKICSAKISCNFPDGNFTGSALCPANTDGSCPSATDCALDDKIQFTDPKDVKSINVYSSESGTILVQ